MIHETAAVEHDLRDALFQSTLGDLFANLGSGLDVAAEVRAKKPPEPYKGKGIRYKGEVVKHKEGKAGKGKK